MKGIFHVVCFPRIIICSSFIFPFFVNYNKIIILFKNKIYQNEVEYQISKGWSLLSSKIIIIK